MRSDLFPGAPSRENRLLCLITFRCIVADSRSRRYPIGRTVCIGKSLNGRADRAHIRCANPQRPERSFQALPLLSLAEVAACFRMTLEAEARCMTRTVPPKRVLALPDLQQSKRLSRSASPQGASISQKCG